MNGLVTGGAPNYFPNSFSGPVDDKKYLEHSIPLTGDVGRYNTADDDNFTQVGTFWNKVQYFCCYLVVFSPLYSSMLMR